MDICREDRTDEGKTAPINQGTQFVSFYFLIAIITGRPLFLEFVIDFPECHVQGFIQDLI